MPKCLLFSFFGTLVEGHPDQPDAVPGVTGMLRRLAKHYRIGLVTNSSPEVARPVLVSAELNDLFQTAVYSAEIGFEKPAPEIFHAALTQLQVEPEEATYIGDSNQHDYLGAKGVGMSAMLIGRHARVAKEHMLRSILDLPIHFNVDR